MSDHLRVICWKWKDSRWPTSYGAAQVNTLADMVRRNLGVPHEFLCITDDARGIDLDIGVIPLWNDLSEMGHCYRRLKVFSGDVLEYVGPRFLSLGLDSVIVGSMNEIACCQADFAIAKDTQPPTPYNGSMFLLKTGSRSKVWESFDPETSPDVGRKLGYCACDQAWIAACLGPNEHTWDHEDGVKSFRNDVLLKQGGNIWPTDRIVFFHGNRKPWDPAVKARYPWVEKNYRDDRQRLVVLGGAPCVWEDLVAYAPPPDAKIMVINDMGAEYRGRVDYWVSLHPEKMGKWQKQRAEKGLNTDYLTIAYQRHATARVDIVSGDWGGSSGLFAVKVGIENGFDHIVLCGVPMDERPNIFRPGEAAWSEFRAFRSGWEKHAHEIKGSAYSMSGWTRALLNP